MEESLDKSIVTIVTDDTIKIALNIEYDLADDVEDKSPFEVSFKFPGIFKPLVNNTDLQRDLSDIVVHTFTTLFMYEQDVPDLFQKTISNLHSDLFIKTNEIIEVAMSVLNAEKSDQDSPAEQEEQPEDYPTLPSPGNHLFNHGLSS